MTIRYNNTKTAASAVDARVTGIIMEMLPLLSTLPGSERALLGLLEALFQADRADAMRFIFLVEDQQGFANGKAFELMLRYAAFHHTPMVAANIDNISYYGTKANCRCLLDTPVGAAVQQQLWEDSFFPEEKAPACSPAARKKHLSELRRLAFTACAQSCMNRSLSTLIRLGRAFKEGTTSRPAAVVGKASAEEADPAPVSLGPCRVPREALQEAALTEIALVNYVNVYMQTHAREMDPHPEETIRRLLSRYDRVRSWDGSNCR